MSNTSDQEITDLLNNNGAFFAFSDAQFKAASVEGVEYVSLGIGLSAPKDKARIVAEGIRDITKKAREQDKAERSPKEIMWREFSNHECQIVGDCEDAIDALAGYGFTTEDIRAEFALYMDHCCENDLF